MRLVTVHQIDKQLSYIFNLLYWCKITKFYYSLSNCFLITITLNQLLFVFRFFKCRIWNQLYNVKYSLFLNILQLCSSLAIYYLLTQKYLHAKPFLLNITNRSVLYKHCYRIFDLRTLIYFLSMKRTWFRKFNYFSILNCSIFDYKSSMNLIQLGLQYYG